jgi:hypothetical protein
MKRKPINEKDMQQLSDLSKLLILKSEQLTRAVHNDLPALDIEVLNVELESIRHEIRVLKSEH